DAPCASSRRRRGPCRADVGVAALDLSPSLSRDDETRGWTAGVAVACSVGSHRSKHQAAFRVAASDPCQYLGPSAPRDEGELGDRTLPPPFRGLAAKIDSIRMGDRANRSPRVMVQRASDARPKAQPAHSTCPGADSRELDGRNSGATSRTNSI